MDCSHVQDWLFEAAEPAAPPADIAEHLAACPACRDVAAQIRQLEAKWRSLPLPANLIRFDIGPGQWQVRGAMPTALSGHASPVEREPESMPTQSRGHGARLPKKRSKLLRWAMAAAALLVIGVGVYLALPDSEAQAAPDVVDRLLDWNVALREAPLADRGNIYQGSADELRAAAASPALSADDVELAKTLLDNAAWLSKNSDPMAEIERLSAVDDKLLARIQRTAKSGKKGELGRSAGHFAKVDRAIRDSLEQAKSQASPFPQERQRLLALAQSDRHRHDALDALLRSVSKSEQRTIRKALESSGHAKSHKHKKAK
jgi:hypothetical protein